MNIIERACRLIEEQQENVKKGSAAWCVGEQLKDLCRDSPAAAELLQQDLQRSGMGIQDAEKRIAAAAKKNRQGNMGFVGPRESEKILREFYGLPPAEEAGSRVAAPERPGKLLDLTDFL